MKSIKYILLLLVFSTIYSGCEDGGKYINVISNLSKINYEQYKMGNEIDLGLSSENFDIDSFTVAINDKIYRTEKVKLELPHTKYGRNALKLTVYYDKGKKNEQYGNISVFGEKAPKILTFDTKKTHFHNPNSFTQGLFIENGFVYESSGLYKKSFLAKYPLGSKTYSKQVRQADSYFAEGITKFQNEIYQLTWNEQAVFKYNFETFELEQKLNLPSIIKEGWGICSDGEHLIISNGSQYLFFVKPVGNSFTIVKTIQAVDNQYFFSNLNELEFINNKIYANVWKTNMIAVIDPATGIVENLVDLSILAQNKSQEQVLNGVADLGNNQLLVTGKNWDKMYEIELK